MGNKVTMTNTLMWRSLIKKAVLEVPSMDAVRLGETSDIGTRCGFSITTPLEYDIVDTHKFILDGELWQFEYFTKLKTFGPRVESKKELNCQLQLVTEEPSGNKSVRLVRITTTFVPKYAIRNEQILKSPITYFYKNGDRQHYIICDNPGETTHVLVEVYKSIESIGHSTKNFVKVAKSEMRSNVLNWFESEDFGDVTIVAADGHKFKCHRDILARRSEVFRLMFNTPMKESKENLVNIDKYEGEIVASLLQFIYIDECDEIGSVADRLYVVAHHYQLDRLKILCESALAANLSASSIVKTYRLATFYHLDQLLSCCVDYLDTHKAELPVAQIVAEAMKVGEEPEAKRVKFE